MTTILLRDRQQKKTSVCKLKIHIHQSQFLFKVEISKISKVKDSDVVTTHSRCWRTRWQHFVLLLNRKKTVALYEKSDKKTLIQLSKADLKI